MQRKLLSILTMACAAAAAHGADLSVPYFALLTNGRLNDASGAFELSTRVGIDIMIEGGSKFDAWFKLGFRNVSMEDYLLAAESPSPMPDVAAAIARLEESTGLTLRTVAIEVKDFMGTPASLAAFVGHLDTFASGADFPALFGASDFATKFRGYMYYPDGIGGDPSRRYDGLHEVYGTGVRVSLPGERILPFFYLYQDSWLGAGHWSADARVLLDSDKAKLEAFAGASFPDASVGTYRAGFLFYFDTGAIGDFYAQIGVPRWDPAEAFGMDMLYFMFEPRVRFGAGMLTLSLFFHPAWYLQSETGESGAMELRTDLSFGELREGQTRGGVEVELSYDPNLATDVLRLDAAPYVQLIRNGVRWDLRLVLRAFPVVDPWYGMFMPTIGVTTSF